MEKSPDVLNRNTHQYLIIGGGEMGALIRGKDWSHTPVGPVHSWPQSLVTTVNLMLNTNFGMFLFWGPDYIQFYNDAYRPSLGLGKEKHPKALGQKGIECWKEIWFAIGPRLEKVMTEGISVSEDNHHLPIFRNGIYEDVYWTYSYSPVFGADGKVAGVLVVEVETTHEIVVERRSRVLNELVASFHPVSEKKVLYEKFASVLQASREDVPFSLLYIQNKDGNALELAAITGNVLSEVVHTADAIPEVNAPAGGWPVWEVIKSGRPLLVNGHFGTEKDTPQGHIAQSVKQAYILPVTIQNQPQPFGAFVAGISPRQLFDEEYKKFLYALIWRLASSIQHLRTQREKRESDEALKIAVLDLEAQKRLYDSLVRSTPDLVYVIGSDYKFRFANAALLQMWGRTLEDSLGKRLIELGYEPWHARMHECEIDQVIATKQSIRGEVAFPHATLGERFYDYIFAPIFGKDGEVIAIAGTTRDITMIKQLEKQKDYFIATASHELKTPLTSVKAYTQILQMNFESKGDTLSAEMMRKMDTQLNKLTNLINDLLDITKIETGKLQLNKRNFEINELIKETAEEIQRTACHHSIQLDLAPESVISGDRDRISQVLINYLTNAIKYSPGADLVKVRSTLKENTITVGVEDFGLGISDENKKHLFERFYRVEGNDQETYPGLGLGLFISKEIISRHNGKTWVESRIGKGSVFYFSLPVAKEAF